jgi:hypothetical protein
LALKTDGNPVENSEIAKVAKKMRSLTRRRTSLKQISVSRQQAAPPLDGNQVRHLTAIDRFLTAIGPAWPSQTENMYTQTGKDA